LAKFRGGVSVDTITELTSGSGVTIDGRLIKDGEIQNNGSADSPRGYAVSSGASGYTFTATGASRLRYSAPTGGACYVTLPKAGIKAGVVYEVLVTGATETNCVVVRSYGTNGTDGVELGGVGYGRIGGEGKITVMALVDTPAAQTDWGVLDVNEQTTLAGQTYTFNGGGTITNKTLICSRSKVFAGVDVEAGTVAGSASNSGYLLLPIPGRFLSSDGWTPCSVTDNSDYFWGMINVALGRVYPGLAGVGFGTTGVNGFTFGPKITWPLS
jgi:hypothetical protein